jgi:hypothetical protein
LLAADLAAYGEANKVTGVDPVLGADAAAERFEVLAGRIV